MHHRPALRSALPALLLAAGLTVSVSVGLAPPRDDELGFSDRATRMDRQPDPPRRHEHPANLAQAFDRGVAALNADDFDAAADAFEEAVRLAPRDPEARINLGIVYLRLQRSDDALRELSIGASLRRARPVVEP